MVTYDCNIQKYLGFWLIVLENSDVEDGIKNDFLYCHLLCQSECVVYGIWFLSAWSCAHRMKKKLRENSFHLKAEEDMASACSVSIHCNSLSDVYKLFLNLGKTKKQYVHDPIYLMLIFWVFLKITTLLASLQLRYFTLLFWTCDACIELNDDKPWPQTGCLPSISQWYDFFHL